MKISRPFSICTMPFITSYGSDMPYQRPLTKKPLGKLKISSPIKFLGRDDFLIPDHALPYGNPSAGLYVNR